MAPVLNLILGDREQGEGYARSLAPARDVMPGIASARYV